VIALLEAKSFHVVAVQNPLTSLADDVAATKRIIALQDGPVILVGHSYAGVVITEAGNDPKVVGLVYVAAFAPGEGESINRSIPPELEKDEAAAIKATSITVPCNHLAMLSHPREVAELIEQAAAKAK
jgi:predicted alpha/beta hydrolase family esterase